MSEADIEVVRDQYDAVNERDFARAMSHYADDVMLVVPPAEGVPSPGTYEGKEAVGRWFGDWFRTFDRDYRIEITEASDVGDLAFIVASHSGHGRASGAEVHGSFAYLYRVMGGKIVRVGFFETRELALEAANLPEWSGSQTD
jgi:ketosteroid isomerase-like protein